MKALSEDFGSKRRLAELLDVSPAQITRWRRGQGIDDTNAARVDLLEMGMAQLLRLYRRSRLSAGWWERTPIWGSAVRSI
ncbi:MAG: hypothetical protein ACRDX8_01570 [Acidimicrobiales bacterium]